MEGWRFVQGAASPGAVLVVDFVPSAPTTSPLVDLACSVAGGAAVLVPKPPLPGTEPERCVQDWMDSLPVEQGDVRAVFGHCGGSALACALANPGRAHQPAVVIYDPYPVDRAVLLHELQVALDQYAGIASVSMLEAALAEARSTASRHEDLSSSASVVDRVYRDVSTAVLGEMQVDVDVIEELTARFRQYLGFLMACSVVDFDAASATATAVMSTGFESPAGFSGIRVPTDIAHKDQLRSDEARAIAWRAMSASRLG